MSFQGITVPREDWYWPKPEADDEEDGLKEEEEEEEEKEEEKEEEEEEEIVELTVSIKLSLFI